MGCRGLVGVAAVAALVVVAASALGAPAGWSPPLVLATPYPACVPAKCTTFPQLASNARGDVLASWRRYYGFEFSRPSGFDCQLAVRPRNGAWSEPEPLPEGVCPSFALDAAGNAIAVWKAPREGRMVVLAQVRLASGAWRRGQRVSAPTEDVDVSEVAVAASGRSVVALWASRGGTGSVALRAATLSPQRRFGPPQTIWTGLGSPLLQFRVAVSAKGDAIVGWSTYDRGRGAAYVAFRPAGGPWQPPQTLVRPASSYAGTPAVALGEAGRAIAVWAESVGGSPTRLRAAVATAGGRFGQGQPLSARGSGPNVAFDARGNAVATWQQEAGGDTVAVAASRPLGGAWQAPRTISLPGTRVGSVTSGLAPTGEAIAIWVRHELTSSGALRTVEAAVRPPGGVFGPPRQISTPGLLAGTPQVALGARGAGLVLWEGADGAVEAAAFAP